MSQQCLLPNNRNFELSLSLDGQQMTIQQLMKWQQNTSNKGMTYFKFSINGDIQKVGKGVTGDKAIWLPIGEQGIKIVTQEEVDLPTMKSIQNSKSKAFAQINWIEEGTIGSTKCVVMSMENVANTNCSLSSRQILDQCTDAFTKLKLLPEDEWYKPINLINGKIVDYQSFKTLPERYTFPYKGDSKVLENLYRKGPRWHTRKKDIGKTTEKDTLYQGFKFQGAELKGYTSDKKQYDSYRKLAYMPMQKVRNGKVFDIGCNQGFFTFQSLIHGASDVTALDYEAKHLNFAKDLNDLVFKSNKIKFVEGDADAYLNNYRGTKFDVIIMLSVLHQIYPHFEGSDKFLNRVASMCRYFSFETPTEHPKMKHNAKKAENMLKKHFKVVRLLYQYDAYSPGKRAIFVCYN